ncbi:acyl-CoA dehydrogenase [Actinocrispum sp. NPDC049592]|uniref:acyl-CoA dehydrogenase family protein n=1 Tax=Actinocrispum sp. NPDC049592 TaxID=3154835 RepID=UPI0034479E78
MDFSFSEAQLALTELTRTILADVPEDRLRAAEAQEDRFDPQLWETLKSSGIVDDLGLLEQCSVLVELGRAVAAVPYLFSVVVAGRTDVLATAALSEDEVVAEPDGDGWLLSGTKSCVPAGGIAELFLVPAQTPNGVQVFAVPREAPGLTIERQRVVDNDSEGWLEFDSVPANEIVGGQDLVDAMVTRATVGLCALQLGVTERALELTAEHARKRVQFDRPIGTFQAVAQRLADAYVDVEAIRLTLWQAAWRVSEGLPAGTEVATAKFWAADAGHRIAHTAVHVHGGMGIDMDYPLHRYFVAAKRNEFTLGAATAQLRRIGAALAATPV